MTNFSELPLDLNAQMRLNMVNSQVRPNQVNDRRVVAAMRELPREDFTPEGRLAYTDADIPLGGGRFMPAPMLMARLAQLVMANNPELVLVVGAGSGYGAALLSHAGAKVVALEDTPGLISPALARVAPEVTVVTGSLKAGWPALGPYDAILFEGAIMKIPDDFAKQLTPGGRIVAVLADAPEAAGLGRAVVAEPGAGGFAVARMFDCTARILPAFFPAPAFVF
jgi:protein-L-isoaspartate(D-aspartate) O-methyltransferase